MNPRHPCAFSGACVTCPPSLADLRAIGPPAFQVVPGPWLETHPPDSSCERRDLPGTAVRSEKRASPPAPPPGSQENPGSAQPSPAAAIVRGQSEDVLVALVVRDSRAGRAGPRSSGWKVLDAPSVFLPGRSEGAPPSLPRQGLPFPGHCILYV